MGPATIGMAGFVLVLVLIVARVPIGFALMSVASVCVLVVFAWRSGSAFSLSAGYRPAFSLIEANVYEFVHSYSLSMIPLFIAAGHIAYHTRITTDIYDAARMWMSRLPGGLAMASVIGCGGFSAVSGSSLACASAMGRICVPEMQRFGYSDRLSTASVAAGGTLGSLIPPSVLLIVYGVFTETSVSKLFIAGILPGTITLVGYLVTIWLWARADPAVAPGLDRAYSARESIVALLRTWPAMVLGLTIIGGIYGGVFTATEAAAVSLIFVILFGILSRRLGLAMLVESLRETVISSAALFLIAAGAKVFVAFVSLTGVASALVGLVDQAGLSQWVVLLCIVLMYLVMGMFLDPIGTMLLTLPFVVPLVEGMGLELIWFGVVIVKLLEIGLITPPLGLNVFMVSSVTKPAIPVHTIFIGVTRFLVMDLVVLGLLVAFPILSLALPRMVG